MASPMRTPESLVQRSDSKNPATTCRGMTSSGKPCRRSLASPKSSPAAARQSASRGVVAVLEDDRGNADAAAFYCWQHKDQAQSFQQTTNNLGHVQNTKIVSVEGRTSIDSLVARLGIASIQEESAPSRKPREDRRRPAQTQQPHTPQSQAFNSQQYSRKDDHISSKPPPNRRKPKPQPGFWASLCCMSSTSDSEDDYLEVVRHKRRTSASRPPETTQITNSSGPGLADPPPTHARPQGPSLTKPTPYTQSQRHAASSTGLPPRKPLLDVPSTALNRRAHSAPNSTANLLSYIPGHLLPQTASVLLNELSKPISASDEPGYIYIFWLTDSDATPDSSTAASLLSPPRKQGQRRLSDVATSYSATGKKTIKLKIGRANNVHRRMNEWKAQCGYNLSLVRFYPYIPSSPSSSPTRPVPGRSNSDQQVHMVPHVHRVERLVHLELADKRVLKKCEACGREHREWFEIEATQEGVRTVDEVVRRWCRWAESTPKEV